MKQTTRSLAGCAIVLLLVAVTRTSLASSGAPDAPHQEGSRPTTVSIGEATAVPDAEAKLPVTLSRPDEVRVGAIDIRLAFPKALLEFVRIEPSGVTKALGAKVQGAVESGPDSDSLVLHASISTTATPGSSAPLPDGRLALLVFRVDRAAKPDNFITLTPEATALTSDTSPRPISPVIVFKTRVAVTTPPVPACVFYMH